jgi:hypothetical protein
VVRGSWFVVRGSWFVVRGSWFVVRGSWFVSGVRILDGLVTAYCLNGMNDLALMNRIGNPSREHTLADLFLPPNLHPPATPKSEYRYAFASIRRPRHPAPHARGE